ncbi:MAG: phospholipase D-like domain-containing protein [Sphingobacteriales bacterium]
MSATIDHAKIDDVIKRNIPVFNKPGALTIRPGFKMSNGWITDKPSIVVTVDKKLDGLPDDNKLPTSVEGVPVDVREATGLQRLRAKDPASFQLAKVHVRDQNREPAFPLERSLPSGNFIPAAQKTAASTSAPKGPPKTPVQYTAPAGQPLKKFTKNMSLICWASPDDGFTVLKDFLSQTKTDLTIAMYDFTSADILKEMISVIEPGNMQFKLILDHPPRNPTANQTDDVTRTDLLDADTNAAINWALTRSDPVVTEWIYPTAYHIKVAVRDSKAFMLSSGNYNVSNQPNLAAGNAVQGSLKNADRDWHVIVLDPEMALLFKAYIDHDFAAAQNGQSAGSPILHESIKSAMASLQAETDQSSFKAVNNAAVSVIGKQKLFNNVPVSIQPILTPDPGVHTSMYVDNTLALIESATQKVYMQTQYIHPSSAALDQDFMLLVNALVGAVKNGLDVRLITSEFENTPQWMEKMKEVGLDGVLKIQQRVHNKGIVIDSKTVMVSSQNWSADGTLRNRDAGVIIENADIAKYYEAIFLDDWENRAKKKVTDVSQPAPGGGEG